MWISETPATRNLSHTGFRLTKRFSPFYWTLVQYGRRWPLEFLAGGLDWNGGRSPAQFSRAGVFTNGKARISS